MEHDLVRRAQQGDRDAFGAIVHVVLARLYASARLIVRDAELAEDGVQDALIDAWRDIRGLRDPDRLDAWLHRLLVRSCYRAARRDRRRRVTEVPLVEDMGPTFHDVIGDLVERDRLERALDRLTLEHRTALVLAYYADLPLVDVAAALAVPVGTAKSRLHRASDALRAALAAEDRTERDALQEVSA